MFVVKFYCVVSNSYHMYCIEVREIYMNINSRNAAKCIYCREESFPLQCTCDTTKSTDFNYFMTGINTPTKLTDL